MTTISLAEFNLSPEIVLGQEEHRTLLVLALAGRGHTADDADGLLYELERAKVVDDAALPADTVRMGSRVRYRAGGGADQLRPGRLRDRRHVDAVPADRTEADQ